VKILVIRFSSIGDIVLTSPVLRCLKQQTGAEIHFLTKSAFQNILSANPYVDKIFVYKSDLNEVLSDLKSEHYDFVVDLHHNLRSLRIKLALGSPSASFQKLNIQKWLLVNTGINRMPNVHIVHRYMDTLRRLNVRYDGDGLDFFIPYGADQMPENLPAFPKHYIAFVLGATHATKRMPTDLIAALCKRINHPVLLLGGPSEAEAGAIVAQLAGAEVHDLSGKLSLFQSAAVVRDAVIVLTHDTGLMHIAAAYRKRIISLWGNTVPEFGMYPFYPNDMALNTSFEVSGLSCRPCSKIGHQQCPKGHFNCMKNMDILGIAAEVEQYMKQI
jgi:ADP-heptose:LPS heptosyltransferase